MTTISASAPCTIKSAIRSTFDICTKPFRVVANAIKNLVDCFFRTIFPCLFKEKPQARSVLKAAAPVEPAKSAPTPPITQETPIKSPGLRDLASLREKSWTLPPFEQNGFEGKTLPGLAKDQLDIALGVVCTAALAFSGKMDNHEKTDDFTEVSKAFQKMPKKYKSERAYNYKELAASVDSTGYLATSKILEKNVDWKSVVDELKDLSTTKASTFSAAVLIGSDSVPKAYGISVSLKEGKYCTYLIDPYAKKSHPKITCARLLNEQSLTVKVPQEKILLAILFSKK